MLLHILAHVESHELNPEDHGDLPGNLRFADTGGPCEKKGPHRVFGGAKTCPGTFYGGDQRSNRFILSENHLFKLGVKVLQLIPVGS